tara:strand:+ start:35 stop:739 length:705 start_codon:yes stop_codon:yes gene_type:complete
MAENLIKEQYKVVRLQNHEADRWLLDKHYAKRIPPISFTYGITDKDKILGVCTFGSPVNRMFNNGQCLFTNLTVETLELNRLVINSGLPKNILSFFVSQCLKLLPKKLCIISYADPNHNHCGYIYQATNFIYLGQSADRIKFWCNGREIAERTLDTWGNESRQDIMKKYNVTKSKQKGKHLYITITGSNKHKKQIMKYLNKQPQSFPKLNKKDYICKDLDIYYQKTLFENVGNW